MSRSGPAALAPYCSSHLRRIGSKSIEAWRFFRSVRSCLEEGSEAWAGEASASANASDRSLPIEHLFELGHEVRVRLLGGRRGRGFDRGKLRLGGGDLDSGGFGRATQLEARF